MAEAPSASPYAPSRFPHLLLDSEPQPLLNPTAPGRPEASLQIACVHAKLLQSCLTLCDPMDCSLPGSSVHGILLARILERVATPSSKGSSPPRDQTFISYVSCIGRWALYQLAAPGKPNINTLPCKKEIPRWKLLYNTGSPAYRSVMTQIGGTG